MNMSVMKGLHHVDGGRSRIVRRSLTPLVDDVRVRLGLDVALILYQSPTSAGAYVLAASACDDTRLPLPNEPLRVQGVLASRHASSHYDITLGSAIRDYALHLSSVLILPWKQDAGRGWLVAGMRASGQKGTAFDPEMISRFSAQISQAHRLAGLEGATRLRQDVQSAMRAMSVAQVESPTMPESLQTIVAVARTLLGTASSYASIPGADGSDFVFTNFVNIRTSAFRRLRMGPGAGLGGLAREKLRAVRSLNYAEDPQLRQAPVEETLGEGLHSAMCAPLIAADGSLLGLLYAANRTLTPFTENDASLLDEFAEFASLSLRQTEADQHRIAVVRRLEQERLAFQLHDSLVRDLMEIGFTAEAGLAVVTDSPVRNQLEAIGRTAELCLEKVREEIMRMANDGGLAESASVGEIIEQLRSAHGSTDIERSFVVSGAVRSVLPAAVASALVTIAQEAIVNSERHSSASQVEVALEISDDAATIRISDNGGGISGDVLEASMSPDSRHFGLRQMRSMARRMGGSFVIVRDGGGLSVQARLPLATRAPE